MGCGYFQNKTNRTKLTIDVQGIILYYPLYNERHNMYTQTQTDTKIIEAKVELMERINKLLAAMSIMQSNMNKMYARIKKLEKGQK